MMQDLRMRKLGTTEARIIRGKMSCQGAIIAIFAVLILPLHASAWKAEVRWNPSVAGAKSDDRVFPSNVRFHSLS